jgi:thiol-disulfide isomerase/thioredoxin
MDWWSILRMTTFLHLCASSIGHTGSQNKSDTCDGQDYLTNAFMSVVGAKTVMCSEAPPPLPPKPTEWKKPKCKAKVGCDIPLNCLNSSSLTESKGGAFRVLPHDLEHILERPGMNTCAVVMFYASWCPYSVGFARQFNALGRSFKEVPVMAVNVAENDMSVVRSVFNSRFLHCLFFSCLQVQVSYFVCSSG